MAKGFGRLGNVTILGDDVQIRRADTADQGAIANTIAAAYRSDFEQLTKDMAKIARAISSGVQVDRFWVAEKNEKIIGVAACTDINGRAVTASRTDCRKELGYVRGSLAHRVFDKEFTAQLTYPPDTGYIEFVGVLEAFRGQGIAKQLITQIIDDNPQYRKFVLDVTDINRAGISAYRKLGFTEYNRIPAKHPRWEGFTEKIYMKYTRTGQ